MSLVLRMDVLLAGKLILPFAGEALCRIFVQRHLPVENIPGKSNTIPGRLKKCSPSARNGVQNQPGIVFSFVAESCSASPGFPTLETVPRRAAQSENVQPRR